MYVRIVCSHMQAITTCILFAAHQRRRGTTPSSSCAAQLMQSLWQPAGVCSSGVSWLRRRGICSAAGEPAGGGRGQQQPGGGGDAQRRRQGPHRQLPPAAGLLRPRSAEAHQRRQRPPSCSAKRNSQSVRHRAAYNNPALHHLCSTPLTRSMTHRLSGTIHQDLRYVPDECCYKDTLIARVRANMQSWGPATGRSAPWEDCSAGAGGAAGGTMRSTGCGGCG